MADSLAVGSVLELQYNFAAENPDELTGTAGDRVVLVERKDDWLLVRDQSAPERMGLIPAGYVRVVEAPKPAPKAKPAVPPKAFKKATSGEQVGSVRSPGTNTGAAASNPFPQGPPALEKQSSASFQHSEMDLLRLEKTLSSLPPLPSQIANSEAPLPAPVPAPGSKTDSSQFASSLSPTIVPPPPAINPFDALSNEGPAPLPMPIMEDDDHYAEELAQRFRALKSRIDQLDQHLPVAEIVKEPPQRSSSSLSTAPLSGSSPLPPSPPAPTAAEQEQKRLEDERRRREMDEFRERERIRLQKEAEERAKRQMEEAARLERERKEAQEREWQRTRSSSIALSTSAKVQVKYMMLANEDLQKAVVAENNGVFPQAFASYKDTMKNILLALENGQVENKATAVAKVDEIITKLSKPPFSSSGSFDGKIPMLAAMSKYDANNTVFNRAMTLRTQGLRHEQERNIGAAIKLYRDAIEHFIAHKKYLESVNASVDPSLMYAINELLEHAEKLKASVS